MRKRTKIVILGVVLLSFVAIGTKPLWTGQSKGKTDVAQVINSQQQSTVQKTTVETKSSAPKLAKLLDDSFAKGKPVAVVYTYNADC